MLPTDVEMNEKEVEKLIEELEKAEKAQKVSFNPEPPTEVQITR